MLFPIAEIAPNACPHHTDKVNISALLCHTYSNIMISTTGGFTSQRVSNTESISVSLCHHVNIWHHACQGFHDDVIKWKHFPRYWPFVRGIHRSPVNSPHKGQWRGALMFTLICARTNGWVNNREAGDLRHYRPHYDAIVMFCTKPFLIDGLGKVKLRFCSSLPFCAKINVI